MLRSCSNPSAAIDASCSEVSIAIVKITSPGLHLTFSLEPFDVFLFGPVSSSSLPDE
uniref:Uncharacterized protein n=1 Tax=Arundo donax TaxID=35708 RepID=A0A0A9E3Q8_ARUDO